MASEPLTLDLSARDAQWLAATLAVCATLIGDNEDAFEQNADALFALLAREYSATEANAMQRRVRSLIPPESHVQFLDGPFLASHSTLLS